MERVGGSSYTTKFLRSNNRAMFFCLLEGGAAERVSRTNALREMRSLLGHGNLIRFLGPSVEFP